MATEGHERLQQGSTQAAKITEEHRTPVLQLVGLGLIASIIGVVLGLLIDWFPEAASVQAGKIDTLYDVLIICSVPIFVGVMTVVLYSVWRFRMRPGQENMDGPPIHGNTRLEIIWTALPALMMLALCVYSYAVLRDIEDAPANTAEELKIRVVGEQFTWTFYYPGTEDPSKELVSNRLYLPVNRPVQFKVQSKDVIHDFWVPAFRMKIDAVPGIDTSLRVTPNKTGNFPVVCAELCGLGHSVMRQSAIVLTPEEFDKWLQDKQAGESPQAGEGGAGGAGLGSQGGSAGADGKSLFLNAEPQCGACHTLADAGTNATIGPVLDESLQGKDEEYIRRGIVDPNADIPSGFSQGIMPANYGDTLSEEEVDALVDYLVEVTR